MRNGHRVTLLLGGERPVAVINFSTEQYLNLVTPHQFELFGAAEAFTVAALLVGAGLTGLTALMALTVAAGAYALAKWLVRQQRYREVAASVDLEIQRAIAHPRRETTT